VTGHKEFVMADATTRAHALETDVAPMHALVSWRAIVAGLLIALLSLAILVSLGMAVGGIGLGGGTTAQNAGLFTGLWFIVSALISLFLGSYFAARVSKFHTNRVGSAQGLVIASIFFGLFLWQTFSAVTWAGNTATGAVTSVAQGAQQAAGSPVVGNVANNVVEDAVADLQLKVDPQTAVTGIATRLVQGDVDGAKAYLARVSNLSQQEVDQRIDQVQAKLSATMKKAANTAATALQATGWSLFALLVLGSLAAVGGGALGSRANWRKPLTVEPVEVVPVGREPHPTPV
jgi:hypothetical protein